MNAKTEVRSLIRNPSAFVPISMSLAALMVVVGYILMYGGGRQADEGAAAHIWQILVFAQLPLVAFFGLRWLPRAPGADGRIITIQFVALVAAAAPVYFMHL